jgi:hypothetical protein
LIFFDYLRQSCLKPTTQFNQNQNYFFSLVTAAAPQIYIYTKKKKKTVTKMGAENFFFCQTPAIVQHLAGFPTPFQQEILAHRIAKDFELYTTFCYQFFRSLSKFSRDMQLNPVKTIMQFTGPSWVKKAPSVAAKKKQSVLLLPTPKTPKLLALGAAETLQADFLH